MMMTLSMQKWEDRKEGKSLEDEKMPCKVEMVCSLKIFGKIHLKRAKWLLPSGRHF